MLGTGEPGNSQVSLGWDAGAAWMQQMQAANLLPFASSSSSADLLLNPLLLPPPSVTTSLGGLMNTSQVPPLLTGESPREEVMALDCPRAEASDEDEDSQPLPRDSDGKFHCPFPACEYAQLPGKGWVTRQALLVHVSNFHVANGEVPSRGWLRSVDRWACGHCQALHSIRKRKNGTDCYALRAGELPSPWRPGTVLNQALPPSTPKGTPFSSHWIHAPTLSDVLGTHRNLLRHVPKGAINTWGKGLASRIQALISRPCWESLTELCAYPKCTLGLPNRGGRRNRDEAAREVRARVAKFEAEGWLACWKSSEGTRVQPSRSRKRLKPEALSLEAKTLDRGFMNSLQGLLDDGAFSKAAKHLLSEGVHDGSDMEVRAALETLHPKRLPVTTSFNCKPWPIDNSAEGRRARLKALRATILEFPLGSAGGPSGLRPQHLQDVIRQDAGIAQVLLDTLDDFVLHALRGDLPMEAAPFLCSAKLVPLRKPGAKMAVRPIAVGECLRRLVGKIAMRSTNVKEGIDAMVPRQLGVAVEGACETTAMALQHWVHAHKSETDWGVLQVDLANAFNSVDRAVLLEQVAARVPTLSSWAQYCYKGHSHLYLGGFPLSSQQGVQQGDPLGPLLFSLAWHKVVEALPRSLVINSWYLDDGHLVGTEEDLKAALSIIEKEGQMMGIKLNANKCRLWGPAVQNTHEQCASSWDAIPRVPWDKGSGLKVLGLPVTFPGCFVFAEATFAGVVNDLQRACSTLQQLGDTQSEHLLLRYCLDACRVMHYLRGVDCSPLEHLVQQVSAIIRKTWTEVLGSPSLSDAEWEQSTLPLRLAGLGIKDPCVILPPARVAASLTFTARASALHFPKEACVLPPDWTVRVNDLQGTLGTTFDPLDKWAAGDIKLAEVAEDHFSQKWWSHKVHKVRSRRLADKLALRDRARYDLQKMPGTTSWMMVTPNEGLGLKMESRDYRFLLKWWLGMPLVGPGKKTCPCCEQQMDPFGDHLVSCKLNQPVQRHNALRDALTDELRVHNVVAQKEVPIGGSRRPADVAMPSLDSRGPVAVDLVVHHPLSLSENRTSDTTKSSLRKAEEQKLKDSEDLCHGNGWLFSPMGWHTWGGLGPHGYALLRRIEKQIAGDLQGWPRRNLLLSFRSKVTYALMQYVTRQLRAAEDALSEGPDEPVLGPPCRGGPVFGDEEMKGWDTEEEFFVGPIRIRGIRPKPSV